MTASRYAIGIDLGTTNCTLAYVDLRPEHVRVETLPIPQLRSLRTIVESPLLPSFFYYPTEAELDQGELDPFSAKTADESAGYVIGAFAREQMTALPGRVIHSAKSWLAHAGVDREAQMLPFASEEIPTELRLSPVEASSAYLGYLKAAWDHAFARDDAGSAFTAQRIVITVPASFDEGAQQLTRMAAEMAGYPAAVRLLEEPQAAFYAWLDAPSRTARAPGAPLLECLPAIAEQPQTVLVCDVGGGTTDFSLFRIAPVRTAADRPAIERIAVSDHLLLGGDNIDLALAHALERMLKPDSDDRLSRSQWSHLVPQARSLKERVLDADGDALEVFHVALPGDGTSLFAAALDATVTRGQIRDIVLEGFFPSCPSDAVPLGRKGGLREMGLPYAADTAISRHLAAFLSGRHVDAVLFAGGTLRPRAIQERLLAVIEAWQGRRPGAPRARRHEPRHRPGCRALRRAAGGRARAHPRRLSAWRVSRGRARSAGRGTAAGLRAAEGCRGRQCDRARRARLRPARQSPGAFHRLHLEPATGRCGRHAGAARPECVPPPADAADDAHPR